MRLTPNTAEELVRRLAAFQDRETYHEVAQVLLAAKCGTADLRPQCPEDYEHIVNWGFLEREICYALHPEDLSRDRQGLTGTDRDRRGTDVATGGLPSVPSRSHSSSRSLPLRVHEPGRRDISAFLSDVAAHMRDELPPAAEKYSGWHRRLLSLCRACEELQEAGREDFFLPCRKAAEALGLDPERYRKKTHVLLTLHFVRDRLLEVVARGQGFMGGRANRYRLGPAWREPSGGGGARGPPCEPRHRPTRRRPRRSG